MAPEPFRAIYPGTFDPITNGHLDVIRRGAALFDELIVAVAHMTPKNALFTVKERVEMAAEATADLPNVRVEAFDGMAVEYVRSRNARVMLRGIRTFSDFDYEFQLALTNRALAPDIETVFIMSAKEYSFLHSRNIKAAAAIGGDVSAFVPAGVMRRLREKFQKNDE